MIRVSGVRMLEVEGRAPVGVDDQLERFVEPASGVWVEVVVYSIQGLGCARVRGWVRVGVRVRVREVCARERVCG